MFNNIFKKKEKVVEPWVDIIESDYDVEHGWKFKLDWNQEFIVYLKENGYNGDTDELIVEKWMQDTCDSIDSQTRS